MMDKLEIASEIRKACLTCDKKLLFSNQSEEYRLAVQIGYNLHKADMMDCLNLIIKVYEKDG